MGISQEEIVINAQTVTKGLEALKAEHQSLLHTLKTTSSPAATPIEPAIDSSLTEKASLLEKSLEMIDLGLGEAHVMAALASHLQVRVFLLFWPHKLLSAFVYSALVLQSIIEFMLSLLHQRLSKLKSKNYDRKSKDFVKKMHGYVMNWLLLNRGFKLQSKQWHNWEKRRSI